MGRGKAMELSCRDPHSVEAWHGYESANHLWGRALSLPRYGAHLSGKSWTAVIMH